MSGADAAKTSKALRILHGDHFEASKKATRPKVAGSLCSTMAKATTSFRSSLSETPVVPTATPAGQKHCIQQTPTTLKPKSRNTMGELEVFSPVQYHSYHLD